MKIDNDYLRTAGNTHFKEKIICFVDFLEENEIGDEHLCSKQILNAFEKHIVESAKEITKKETKHCPDHGSNHLNTSSSSISI